MDNLTPKEIADEEMINQAFHELLIISAQNIARKSKS